MSQHLSDIYYKQLDGLRTLAAFGVINFHWFNDNYLHHYGIEYDSIWAFGRFGVQLFFVLSGFLISDILLRNKEKSKVMKVLKNFLVRRILRLFPAYFLFVTMLIMLKDSVVIENIFWYLGYCVNILFFINGDFMDPWSNHLWTLSVEEQFYLFFPVCILTISKRLEYCLPLFLILFSIAFKIFLIGDNSGHLLTFYQLDMLGAGVFVAILKNRNPFYFNFLSKFGFKFGLIISLLISLILIFVKPFSVFINTIIIELFLVISFALLVVNATKGFSGPIGRFLKYPLVGYLGKISYGLYLYHKIIPLLLIIVLTKIGLKIDNIALYYFVNTSILILISHISWQFFEKPILGLKKKFNY